MCDRGHRKAAKIPDIGSSINQTLGVMSMFARFRFRWCRAFGALMLTLLSGGCVAYSSDPGYGYYGGPFDRGGVVTFGDSWHHGHHDWYDHG
jgi:hypothetical protein